MRPLKPRPAARTTKKRKKKKYLRNALAHLCVHLVYKIHNARLLMTINKLTTLKVFILNTVTYLLKCLISLRSFTTLQTDFQYTDSLPLNLLHYHFAFEKEKYTIHIKHEYGHLIFTDKF